MLLSMTGFGAAQHQEDRLMLNVEARAINNRYFKLSLKCPDGYGAFETQIENFVRDRVKRGTVQLAIRTERAARAEDYRLNGTAIDSYRKQLEALQPPGAPPIQLERLLVLPGVVFDGGSGGADTANEWPRLEKTIGAAIDALNAMRAEEGRKMANDLRANLAVITRELAAITERAPQVVEAFRARLTERIKAVLDEYQVKLEAGDLIREVSVYAERTDIAEEIVRLRSHLEQFDSTMKLEESSGRKLEFITQEMLRETNTIGSKANDVTITRHVVEIKGAIEKIREMVQNLE